MSRFPKSGVLWFWMFVVGAMVAVTVVAYRAEPSASPRTHPHTFEMFADAVNMRHNVALAFRTGDPAPLRKQVDSLTTKWAADGSPDNAEGRSAAVAVLTRISTLLDSGDLDAAWRDKVIAEADLFAALAADPTDTDLAVLATSGYTAAAGMRPTSPAPKEFETAEERLADAVARGGITTLDEIRDRLKAAGAPTLSHTSDPKLVPPTAEDLPR